ncbi:MAG: hypothetical protein HC896_11115 [Bacteroidales bacterium]|nr:hypothetical protein [Bacteroidales bacterium]
MTHKAAVLLIYADPEGYYPPTLYAIDNYANTFEQVTVVCRKFFVPHWPYPDNVKLIYTANLVNRSLHNISTIKKLSQFAKFTLVALKQIIKSKPSLIVAYDDIPLLSILLIPTLFFRKAKYGTIITMLPRFAGYVNFQFSGLLSNFRHRA